MFSLKQTLCKDSIIALLNDQKIYSSIPKNKFIFRCIWAVLMHLKSKINNSSSRDSCMNSKFSKLHSHLRKMKWRVKWRGKKNVSDGDESISLTSKRNQYLSELGITSIYRIRLFLCYSRCWHLKLVIYTKVNVVRTKL